MIFYFSVAAAVTAHCADSHVATTAITNSVAAVLLSRLLPSPPLRLAGTCHQQIVDSKYNSCCSGNIPNHDATSTADWSMPSSASWFLFVILYFIAAVAVAPHGAVATSVTTTNLFRSSLLCHHLLQWCCAASTAACWCFAVTVHSLLPFLFPLVSCNIPTWHCLQCCLLSSPPSCLLSKCCLFLCSSPRGYDWCCWFAGSRLIVALHIFEILLLWLL